MPRYDAQRIEPKWQQYWDTHQTFATGPFDASKEKLYVLDMFPYPSGAGLHVGHPEGYTATDIVCRFNRMRGKQVMHPMGWDAFGLPAEDYAIKTGTHPAITTAKNIETFKRQLKSLGFSYDWNRELATTDEDYYRWTQWIFLKLFDTWYDPACEWTGPDGKQRVGRGRPISELPIPADVKAQGAEAVRRYQDSQRLAYQQHAPVNWCPALGTVLANEEVIDGKSERGGHPVERFPLRQWMLRITAYAERLIDELEDLTWPESIKEMQRNWIGRSTGAEVDFYIGAISSAPLAPQGRGAGGEGRCEPGVAPNSPSPPTPLPEGARGESACGFEAWKTTRANTGFPKTAGDDVLRIYTTRPDTLFGVTYMVLAPEHPFVERLTTPEQREAVEAYRKQAALKSDLDRTDLAKSKTGVFTGGYAINPVNGEKVPVWVADYVLISYGTGAIMAVPAHDERDWEFAETFNIPIKTVVAPANGAAGVDYSVAPTSLFSELGVAVNSGSYDGMPTNEFKAKITDDLATAGLARKAINYRLRDWLFSRQRYWGEPFPIWHEIDADGNQTGLMRVDSEAELPIRLPQMAEFKPTGTPDPMLSKAPQEWLYKTAADGTKLKRETNTMPQWAGSCWYYIRFVDPKNDKAFIDPLLEKQWLPIDLYVGGAEHAVLHLLYSRFWHKVLFDRGLISSVEPFQRLVNQGLILGEVEFTGFKTEAGEWVSAKDVEEVEIENNTVRRHSKTKQVVTPVKLEPTQVEKKGENFIVPGQTDTVIDARAFKMSKSRGNVVNPDSVVSDYGADSLRLYEMFMGPLEQVKPWSTTGVEGVFRFLCRAWRMITDEDCADQVRLHPSVQDVAPNADQERLIHKTIKNVTGDIESLGFNRAIARMMEFLNEVSSMTVRPKSIMEPFVLLLAPFAPHIAEELWELLGHTKSLAYEPWPTWDEAKLVEAEIEVPVQVNGKLRATIKVPTGSDAKVIEDAARASDKVVEHLTGKNVVKVVYVPGRMINFVVK